MKLLVNGIWHSDFQLLEEERIQTGSFRDVISADGSSRFQVESDRYHLYVSFACPFAHRTILARQLKRLESVISMSVLSPDWGDPNGWMFGNWDNTTPDTVNGCDYLHQVYVKAKPNFTGIRKQEQSSTMSLRIFCECWRLNLMHSGMTWLNFIPKN